MLAGHARAPNLFYLWIYVIYAVAGNRQRIDGARIHRNRLTNYALKGRRLSGISSWTNQAS